MTGTATIAGSKNIIEQCCVFVVQEMIELCLGQPNELMVLGLAGTLGRWVNDASHSVLSHLSPLLVIQPTTDPSTNYTIIIIIYLVIAGRQEMRQDAR